jgi:demethylmenaquinone methyltransferase/2-methoxy-6-polyprenyl-1,4-benzoquinol methylase
MATKDTYERIARWYDALDIYFEYARYRAIRRQLFAGLSGRLLDAGVGTGRNMPFYPAGGEVVGIDLSPAMLSRAERRRARLGRKVELHEMDVCATGFPDDHFDAVAASFLFCVLDDDQQGPALRELARICKPGGEIRLLDYTLSENPVRRFVMRLLSPWVRWLYGAAFDRDTKGHIAAAGLELAERRFVYHDVIELLVIRPGA